MIACSRTNTGGDPLVLIVGVEGEVVVETVVTVEVALHEPEVRVTV